MLKKKEVAENDIINDQFVILGKFDNKRHSSKIYKGWDRTEKSFVVIKITSSSHKEKTKQVTKYLQKLKGGVGIPSIIWRGTLENQTVTVTECLGPNLKKLFLLMDKQFSISTVAMIGLQLLTTLEYIHKHDIVCCNIMPKEILISLNRKNLSLFITDYKQAKKRESPFRNEYTHTPCGYVMSFVCHVGPTKKDDLESLAYILIYFLRGQIFTGSTKFASKDEKIKFYEQNKLALIPEDFCAKLPTEIMTLFSYIKSLQLNFKEHRIDYDFCRKLMKGLLVKSCSSLESFQYDWIMKAISMGKNIKNQLVETSTKDESCINCDAISNDRSKDSFEKLKKVKFREKISTLAAEDPDNIILALDKHFGIDMLSIPDEGSNFSENTSIVLEDEAEPISRALHNPTTFTEHQIKTMSSVKTSSLCTISDQPPSKVSLPSSNTSSQTSFRFKITSETEIKPEK